jgi:Restriction alleviation protein Lar
MTEIKLEPCPVCKSRNVSLLGERQDGLFVVSCENDDCDFIVEAYGGSAEEAVRRWNTRPAPAVCAICGQPFQKGDDVVLLPAPYHQACYLARSSSGSAPMRQHSETAWNIASRYSAVLASETRDLATAIDEALRANAQAALPGRTDREGGWNAARAIEIAPSQPAAVTDNALAQALYEAECYGIGATSDTNKKVILQAAKELAIKRGNERSDPDVVREGKAKWPY